MNIAVIFAGGVGIRMNSKDCPKQFLKMYNKPIIIHTLEHFENHPEIDAIVAVCVDGWINHLKELLYKYRIDKVKMIVSGGATGQQSIYNGLVAAEELCKNERAVVLIHDGVRPLINAKLISDNIKSVRNNGSAITTSIVKETVLIIGQNNEIETVPDRSLSRMAKAPQSFWLDEIIDTHRKAIEEEKLNFIDSCSMMQYYGKQLYLVDGPSDNIKITTSDDFYTMRALIDAKENAQIYGTE